MGEPEMDSSGGAESPTDFTVPVSEAASGMSTTIV
jgi:hypothetical protein